MVAADIGRGYRSQLRLDDLADLLFERHARHEVGDEGFDGRVESGRYRSRPTHGITVATRDAWCCQDAAKCRDQAARQKSGVPTKRCNVLQFEFRHRHGVSPVRRRRLAFGWCGCKLIGGELLDWRPGWRCQCSPDIGTGLAIAIEKISVPR